VRGHWPKISWVYGVLDFHVPGVGGWGSIGSRGAAGRLSGNFAVLALELGHNFGRDHAPCGTKEGLDDNFPQYYDPWGNPYPAASIGQVGVRVGTGRVYAPVTAKDFMSYGGPPWGSPTPGWRVYLPLVLRD